MDTGNWIDMFDERQQKEIALSRLYAKDFHHGTDGHNAKMIIALLADLLDRHYPSSQLPLIDSEGIK
jgi:hypothetical protein